MQTRFHNFHRPLIALEENHRMVGAISPGVYRGFDSVTPQAGTILAFSHAVTGIRKTGLGGTVSNPMSLVVTSAGVFVYEDAPIEVSVGFNGGNSSTRIDLLIMTHSYIDSDGGATASYSVISGQTGVAKEPTISNPAIQTAIGFIIVPGLATNHGQTTFIRLPVPKAGGQGAYSTEDGENNLLYPSTNVYTSDFDNIFRPGIYFTAATTHKPSGGDTSWFVMVMRRGSAVFQLAIGRVTAKVYTRSGSGLPPTIVWGAWGTLSNSDVTSDFQAILDIIGTRTYTPGLYLSDGDTLTSSLDDLNVALGAVESNLSPINTNIANILGFIGDLLYEKQVIVTNSESITASIDKLDKIHRNIQNTEDLNHADFLVPGKYIINPIVMGGGFAHPTNAPNFDSKVNILDLEVSDWMPTGSTKYKLHILTNTFTRSSWRRIIDYNAGSPTYGAWACVRTAVENRVIGDWDLSAGFRQFNHGLVASRIVKISATIRDDAGTNFLDLFGSDNTTGEAYGNIYWNATQVSLQYIVGGPLDGDVNYNGTGFSRGYCIIEYIDGTPV